MDIKKAILFGAGGFAGAVVTDLDAFIKDPSNVFNWKLAAARWAKGAITGVLVGLGIQGVSA